MSPRTFVTRAAAILALATFGLAACETKTVVSGGETPLTISVSPSAVTLSVGGTAQIVALVTGGPTGTAHTATWSSSNANVASVDANGVVTAKAAGTASIIATATADATVKAAAAVTVSAVQHVDTVPPSVSIKSITENDGSAVNLQDVEGEINVTLNVDVPVGNNVTAVNWLIDGQNVCSQNFTKASAGEAQVEAVAAVEMSCQINTADTTAAGVAKFLNGSHTLSATLVSGTTIKASTSQILIFGNEDRLLLVTSASKGPVNSASGFAWYAGNLTVTARPLMYSGATVARVVFSLLDDDPCYESSRKSGVAIKVTNPCGDEWATVTDTLAPFTTTFRGDTSTGPLFDTTDSLFVNAVSVTVAGAEGPSNYTPNMRFDNEAPEAVQFFFNDADGWKNGPYKFMSAIDTSKTPSGGSRYGPVDFGVDRITYVFSAGPTRDSLTTVVTGADLADSQNRNRYAIKVVITDALGNAVTEWGSVSTLNDTTVAGGGHFGIDTQAPTIDFAPITIRPSRVAADTSFTTVPAKDFAVEYQDLGASGFATTTPVQVTVVRYDTVSTNNDCLVGSGGTTVAKCTTPASDDALTPVQNAEGYQVYTAYVQDQAGNKSVVISERVLVDMTAPTDAGFAAPTTLKGGSAATFTDTAKDNLDLGSYTAQIDYLGGPFSIAAGSGSLGTYGQDVLSTAGLMSATSAAFIRSITAPGIGCFAVQGVSYVVKDVAGNSVTLAHPITFTSPCPVTFTDLTSWALTSVATNPTTLEATAIINTAGGTSASPFTSVQFYKIVSGVATPIATAASPLISDDVTNHLRTFRYQVAAPALTDGEVIVAVGVTTNGDAATTAPQTLTID